MRCLSPSITSYQPPLTSTNLHHPLPTPSSHITKSSLYLQLSPIPSSIISTHPTWTLHTIFIYFFYHSYYTLPGHTSELCHFHTSQHRLSPFALLSIPFNSTTHNYLPPTISIPSPLSSLSHLHISLPLLTFSLQIHNTLSKRFSPQMMTSYFRWNSRWNSHQYHPFSGKLFGETGEMGKPNKKSRKSTSTFTPPFPPIHPPDHSQTHLLRLQQPFSIRICNF